MKYYVDRCDRPYQPFFARETEKLRVLGATVEELCDLFAVPSLTIERWTHEHEEFSKAFKVESTALGVTSEDIGLFNWLKDYRRGYLA
jgi:hypothetical protein